MIHYKKDILIMKKQRPILALIACSVTVLACIILSNGQTPIGSQWWPSKWGPHDERGAVNRITPEKTVEAAGLIKTGKVYHVGQVYEAGMPWWESVILRPSEFPRNRLPTRAARKNQRVTVPRPSGSGP